MNWHASAVALMVLCIIAWVLNLLVWLGSENTRVGLSVAISLSVAIVILAGLVNA